VLYLRNYIGQPGRSWIDVSVSVQLIGIFEEVVKIVENSQTVQTRVFRKRRSGKSQRGVLLPAQPTLCHEEILFALSLLLVDAEKLASFFLNQRCLL
jgi:hypothetical protein